MSSSVWRLHFWHYITSANYTLISSFHLLKTSLAWQHGIYCHAGHKGSVSCGKRLWEWHWSVNFEHPDGSGLQCNEQNYLWQPDAQQSLKNVRNATKCQKEFSVKSTGEQLTGALPTFGSMMLSNSWDDQPHQHWWMQPTAKIGRCMQSPRWCFSLLGLPSWGVRRGWGLTFAEHEEGNIMLVLLITIMLHTRTYMWLHRWPTQKTWGQDDSGHHGFSLIINITNTATTLPLTIPPPLECNSPIPRVLV